MSVLEILGALFMLGGCVFALTGAVGVLRMPDFYARLHPAGKSDTLAQALILFGLALLAGQQLINAWPSEANSHADAWIGLANIILKLGLLTALLFLTAPTATHAIAKAARLDRYTRLPFDHEPGDDPASSRVAEIVVAGDVTEPLEEPPGPVLDVRETVAEDEDP
ncbi:monovalent cation/H(+) antiporter subunit G [Enhygromyxa salina]|uniref:Na(+)/H(+) antiporter subunit G1 n=1 Tax=Enhygromyxa salina TaxID=215803 RepID=A0A2S9YSA5_9BACT|nr:monovalent cation/H(+) antiporter subunit G [Enhygromyxa salina]PRQ07919.1 Na(+)/H(+) antiporter subunit G1 [Enhygromyxa salina]